MATYAFAFMGQSNMVGNRALPGLTTTSGLEMWNGTAWVQLADPWRTGQGTGGMGPALGNRLRALRSDHTFRFILVAQDMRGFLEGSTLYPDDFWSDKTSMIYTNAITAITASGAVPNAVAVWGGEQDKDHTVAEVKAAIELTISNFRSDLNIPNLPFYFVKPQLTGAINCDSVRTAIDQVIAGDQNTALLTDVDGYAHADNYHLASSEYDKVGKVVGNAVVDLQFPSASESLLAIYTRYTASEILATNGGAITLRHASCLGDCPTLASYTAGLSRTAADFSAQPTQVQNQFGDANAWIAQQLEQDIISLRTLKVGVEAARSSVNDVSWDNFNSSLSYEECSSAINSIQSYI